MTSRLLAIRLGQPKADYFSYKSMLPKIDPYGPIWDFMNMPKWLMVAIKDLHIVQGLKIKHLTEEVDVWRR